MQKEAANGAQEEQRSETPPNEAPATENQVEIAATELKENGPDEEKDVGPVADPEHVEPETPGKDDVQMKEQPCQPQDGTDGRSTVARHEALCGTPEEALRRYIANFARRGGSSGGGMALGTQEPCRSYRSLLVLKQFEVVETKLLQSRTRDDISSTINYYKPFKSALADLLAMSKSGTKRLTAAVERALKARSDAKQHQQQKHKAGAKCRLAAARKTQSVHESALAMGIGMPAFGLKRGATGYELDAPVDNTALQKPFVVRARAHECAAKACVWVRNRQKELTQM